MVIGQILGDEGIARAKQLQQHPRIGNPQEQAKDQPIKLYHHSTPSLPDVQGY
jgi:hypothetical protein